MLELRDLVKNYGSVEAVRGVSFEVKEGEVFGLLGPNGAGKTTVLECAIGLRQADGGTIRIAGIDARSAPGKVKGRIGAVLQSTALQDKITPREALRLFGSFYRRRAEVGALLERFSLTGRADAAFDTLSGGEKQRLALALAFVNEPELVFLDEPTAGVDPKSRRDLHREILAMRDEGRTVVLSTHYIEEAQRLCDRVAILDMGRVVAMGRPEELIAKSGGFSRVSVKTAQAVDAALFRELAGVVATELHGGAVRLKTRTVGATVVELVRLLETLKIGLVDLHIEKPSLEDVFMGLTGKRIEEHE